MILRPADVPVAARGWESFSSDASFRIPIPSEEDGRYMRQLPIETVPAGGRVSLCWSSANHDEEVFKSPKEIWLDRKPAPHISFGIGAHLCLGAPHARHVSRTLLDELVNRVGSIEILSATPHVEHARLMRHCLAPSGRTEIWSTCS